MDAVTPLRKVLFELLIRRPTVPCILSLFYILAAWLASSGEVGSHSGLLVAVLAAIPAAGFCAIATERLVRYAAAAGELGLPRHATTLSVAQLALLLLFVVAPWLAAIRLGAPGLAAAALLLGGAAVGTLLVGMGWLVALLIPTAWVLNAAFGRPEDWLSLPVVQFLAVAGSLVAFWRWSHLPARASLMAPTIHVAYADAEHERLDEEMRDGTSASPTKLAEQEKFEDEFVADAVRGVATGRLSSAGLALGLGYWSGTAWRAVAICVALGVIAVTMARNDVLLRQPHVVYVCLCLGAGFLGLTRVSTIVQCWKRSAAEQGLLVLTPRWPATKQVKAVFLETMVRVQTGAVVGWFGISAILIGLKWIDLDEAAYGALYVITAMLVACSYLSILLGSSVAKEWQFSSNVTALLAIAGVILFQFGSPLGTIYRIAGVAAFLIPSLISFAFFHLRPLQFPANPKARKAES